MTKHVKSSPLLFLMFFVAGGLVFQGCTNLQGVVTEEDAVFSSRRIKANFYYTQPLELFSPLVSLNQTIVKEVKPNSGDQYTVYELIKLTNSSFGLEKAVYILVDQEPFKIQVVDFDQETVATIQENRKDIITSDSTKVSVVTGYDQSRTRETRLRYLMNIEIIDKIKDSKQVEFRYYTGPDMITIRLRGLNLDRLKKLIATK